MGGQISRQQKVINEKKQLKHLQDTEGCDFPGSDYKTASACDRKEWMGKLITNPQSLMVHDIVWPGTHDSATSRIGWPCITRPFAKCQSCSIYKQLLMGVRVLDLRVENSRRICHGILRGVHVDTVMADIKRFLDETSSELIILDIRTEFGHEDPADMDKYLSESLAPHLVPQDPAVLHMTVGELAEKKWRVFCIWRPSKAPVPGHMSPLWSKDFIRDHWVDTDLPHTKFAHNLDMLSKQQPCSRRGYFYRIENTVTPQADNPIVCVRPVTDRIRSYARLFVSQAFKHGHGDRLQVFSTDFIDGDFVDICIGITLSRMNSGSSSK